METRNLKLPWPSRLVSPSRIAHQPVRLSEHGPHLAVPVETPLYHPHRVLGIGVLRLRSPQRPPLRMTQLGKASSPRGSKACGRGCCGTPFDPLRAAAEAAPLQGVGRCWKQQRRFSPRFALLPSRLVSPSRIAHQPVRLSEHGPHLAVPVETPLYHPHRVLGRGVLRLRSPQRPPLRMTQSHRLEGIRRSDLW